MINFFLEGIPVPQGRPRFRRTNFGVITYKTAEDASYRKLLQLQIKSLAVKNKIKLPLETPTTGFDVYIKVCVPRLKTPVKGRVHPITRPDIDNYVKAVFDALNALVWQDDGAVVFLRAHKVYSDSPGIQLVIRAADAHNTPATPQ